MVGLALIPVVMVSGKVTIKVMVRGKVMIKVTLDFRVMIKQTSIEVQAALGMEAPKIKVKLEVTGKVKLEVTGKVKMTLQMERT